MSQDNRTTPPAAAPLFSIICPTFNCRDKVSATLMSVLSQEDVHLECIVADGGSRDGTIAAVETFVSDPRLRCDSQPDAGIYDAMNRALDVARGRFLYFLGAGDRLRPNALAEVAREAQLEAIDCPALIYGDVYSEELNRIYDGAFNRFKLATRNICQQAIFYHRSVFELLGHFENRYRTHADYAFNLRCFGSRQIEKRYVPIVVADYEGGGASAACSDAQFYADRAWLVRKQLGWLPVVYHRYELHGPRNVVEATEQFIRRQARRVVS